MVSSTAGKGTVKRPLTRESQERNRSISFTREGQRTKLLCKSELKSSIPKPTPLSSSMSIQSRSSSSSQIKPILPSKIPKPTFRSLDRGKTSIALKSSPTGNSSSMEENLSCRPLVKDEVQASVLNKQKVRPKSAYINRDFSHVKAKVDTKRLTPTITKLPSKFSPLNVRLVVTPDSSVRDSSKADLSDSGFPTSSGNKKTTSHNKELFDKQRQILKLLSEITEGQSPKERQPLEKEIFRLMQIKFSEHAGNLSKESIRVLTEGSPEFLTTFGKQIQDINDLWLSFIYELSNKLLGANSSMAKPTLSEATHSNIRDMVFNVLASLACEGEAFQIKLQNIEKELSKVVGAVMHNGLALFKEKDELSDKCFRLEKAQEQADFQLKESLAILGEENENLYRKYENAVEKYNLEKDKCEQQEKNKIKINSDMVEVKKIVKATEGKCQEWEAKIKKAETICRALETSFRNKKIIFEKGDLVNKLNESRDTINNLRNELTESNRARNSLELATKELTEKLLSKEKDLEDLAKEGYKMMKELEDTREELNKAQNKTDALQTNITNKNTIPAAKNINDITPKVLIEDLTKDVKTKDLIIEELKLNSIKMDNLLKEKQATEEMLKRQLGELRHQLESDVILKSKLSNVEKELKKMAEEKGELERIAAQRKLELDQRDLLMREHGQVLRAKENLSMFQTKHKYTKDCIERLRAIVIEQKRAYWDQGYDESIGDTDQFKGMMEALEKQYSVDPKKVDEELSFRQEKMTELFKLLEHKQIEMMRLEQKVRDLQGIREEKDLMEKEKEARISSLQRELDERKNGKSRDMPGCLRQLSKELHKNSENNLTTEKQLS